MNPRAVRRLLQKGGENALDGSKYFNSFVILLIKFFFARDSGTFMLGSLWVCRQDLPIPAEAQKPVILQRVEYLQHDNFALDVRVAL